MIIAAVIITCISMTVRQGINADMGILLVSFVLCGLIGFCDDFIKVVKKRNLGLTALQKLIFQIVIAGDYRGLSGEGVGVRNEHLYSDPARLCGSGMALIFRLSRLFSWPLVNAVNLTDGLDGLAGGCVAITALFLALTGSGIGYTEQQHVQWRQWREPVSASLSSITILQRCSWETRGHWLWAAHWR